MLYYLRQATAKIYTEKIQMKKSDNFEFALPEGYTLVRHVDAKRDKKTIIIYSLLSIVPLLIILPILMMCAFAGDNGEIQSGENFLAAMLVGCLVYILYIILHELTHGITYKYYIGQKLTFGLSLTVAFCGVPDIYVRKKASIAALLMPFSVFSVIFLCLTVGLWFVSPYYGVIAGAVFALHLGGCVGDLHWTLMYITKYKHCNTLMRDTGPEQWLYIPAADAEKYGIPVIEGAAV